MEKRVRLFVESTLILLIIGISVQVSAQPEVVTRVPLNSDNFITIGQLVYFTAGDELWRTDGTAFGTTALQTGFDQGHQWGSPEFGREFRGAFYFIDNNSTELWKSDGTPSGTVRLHISGGSDNLRIIGSTNDYLFFQAYEAATGRELYRTNGTAAGTMLVKDINPGTGNGFADHDGPVDPGSNPENPAHYFHLFQTDGVTTQSMRTVYGINTIGTDNIVNFNGKVIFTAYPEFNGETGEPKYVWIYDPANPSGTRASFTMVDSDTDKDIQTINEGDVILKAASSNINIRYNPVETPESVTFTLNGVKVRTETAPPYSLAGDINGDYAAWKDAKPRSYTLTATPYSDSGGNGTAGTPLSVNFTIKEESPSDPCAASGTILREYWEGVQGNRVSDIPLHTAPTRTSELGVFEGPTNSGTNYGARIKGYVCPPSTGEYIFWIASNDHSELWLSTMEIRQTK
jgi:ELWxxDGT repeat protein